MKNEGRVADSLPALARSLSLHPPPPPASPVWQRWKPAVELALRGGRGNACAAAAARVRPSLAVAPAMATFPVTG
jgi:hypothetical protein